MPPTESGSKHPVLARLGRAAMWMFLHPFKCMEFATLLMGIVICFAALGGLIYISVGLIWMGSGAGGVLLCCSVIIWIIAAAVYRYHNRLVQELDEQKQSA